MRQKELKHTKKYDVYEHLEHYVKNTTYADRLQWLQEANDWVNLLKKKKIIPVSPK